MKRLPIIECWLVPKTDNGALITDELWRRIKAMRLLPCILLLSAAASAETVPVPKASRLGFTADSYAFNSASRDLQPLDMAARGYTEEEFILSGSANVYDWAADGSLSVKTPGAPYTTRILVRHPADPAKFSGAVVVEIMNAARQWDWSMMWGYLWPQIVEHGDAWVGVTMPGGVTGLKKYVAERTWWSPPPQS